MIVGIGTDLVAVARIRRLINEMGVRFERRILSAEEQNIIKQYSDMRMRVAYMAKRFAAKEALTKALGVGIGEAIGFADITVYNKASGAPAITLSPKAELVLTEKAGKGANIHISLTDEIDYAQAFVVVESA